MTFSYRLLEKRPLLFSSPSWYGCGN